MNTSVTANEWEAAWGEYIEALQRFDEAKAAWVRRPRGNAREYGKAKTNLGKARERLQKIDPEGTY